MYQIINIFIWPHNQNYHWSEQLSLLIKHVIPFSWETWCGIFLAYKNTFKIYKFKIIFLLLYLRYKRKSIKYVVQTIAPQNPIDEELNVQMTKFGTFHALNISMVNDFL